MTEVYDDVAVEVPDDGPDDEPPLVDNDPVPEPTDPEEEKPA